VWTFSFPVDFGLVLVLRYKLQWNQATNSILNRRQMVLSRFWFGFYGVKLSMLAELAFARRIKLTYEPQSPASTCSRVLAGPP
jgi:hypothetical protein